MTLLEMVIAITVLAIVILAIAGSVNAGLGLVRKAKVQDIATELANGELEKVSRLRNQSDSHAVGGQFSYENVALVGQTPDGRIEPSSVQTVRGIEFTITRNVDFLVDAVPGEPNQQAGYKVVSVTVRPTNADEPVVTAKTIVSPETSSTPGTIFVNVTDAADGSSPREGVMINLNASGANYNRLSKADGLASFFELTPDKTYDVSLNDLSWQLKSCTPTQITPNPLGEETGTCFVYRTFTLGATVRDASNGGSIASNDYRMAVSFNGGGQFGSDGNVFNGQSPPPGALSGTTWTLTELATGRPLVSNLTYNVSVWAPGFAPQSITPRTMPAGYPSSSNDTVAFDLVPAVTGTASIAVSKGGSPASSARVLVVDKGTGATVVKYALTSLSGSIDIDLEPGTYTVTADPGSGTQSADVTVTASTTTTHTFAFP
ncbi:MAG: type II secretion system GspH family protein [Acidimicrobiia bacterium]|nr:type II secretion system GspH family protein [Acidimicrobiia bacterium]